MDGIDEYGTQAIWENPYVLPRNAERMFLDVRKAIHRQYGTDGDALNHIATRLGLNNVQPIRNATANLFGFANAGFGLVMNLLVLLGLDICDYV